MNITYLKPEPNLLFPHVVLIKNYNNINNIRDWVLYNIDETEKTWQVYIVLTGFEFRFKNLEDKMRFILTWM